LGPETKNYNHLHALTIGGESPVNRAAKPRPIHEGSSVTDPRFRLPDSTHVGRVVLQIADLDRSIAFYRDILGLAVLDRDEGPHRVARLAPADSSRALVELREKKGVRSVPRGGLLGLFHFALLLPDRAALGRFVRHLDERDVPAGAADHLFSEALYLVDPDGLTVEVYRDRPRDEWPSRNGELVSASDPLDFDGLLQAAGGDRWQGAPPQSTMGHVHFFVGDLRSADAFYHHAIGFDNTITSWPGALFVSAGGYHHHVGLNTWAAGAPVATDEDARLIEWELVLPDEETVREVSRRVGDAGFIVNAGDAGVRVTDPWGITARLR
jgi:catechol 2,3-dioxygenase